MRPARSDPPGATRPERPARSDPPGATRPEQPARSNPPGATRKMGIAVTLTAVIAMTERHGLHGAAHVTMLLAGPPSMALMTLTILRGIRRKIETR